MILLPNGHFARNLDAGVRLTARVGMATWSLTVTHRALAWLDSEHPRGANPAYLSPVAIDRIMEGLRAKAVGLRCYGGGTMSLDIDDLGTTPVLDTDDAAEPLLRARWFEVIAVDVSNQCAA